MTLAIVGLKHLNMGFLWANRVDKLGYCFSKEADLSKVLV